MQGWVEILLINATAATFLAAGAALAARFVRRPAVVHALWLIVLLKLLTPPLVEVATLPRPETLLPRTAQSAPLGTVEEIPASPARQFEPGVTAAPDTTVPVVETATASERVSGIALTLWAAGGLLLLALTLARLLRFRRLLAAADCPSDGELQALVRRIASRVGLAGCPRVRLLPGRLPPMVWWRPGGSDLLLPAELIDALRPEELEALVAHELAHVKRRDHWVRYVEVLVTALFWWHPVVWWARRNLRAAEESACDALVLRTFPDRACAYAEGLLKTLDFLSGFDRTVPALASGAIGKRRLEERLTMIVTEGTPRRTGTGQRILLAALAVTALLVFPTWVDRTAAEESPATAEERGYREEVLDLERQAIELEAELRAVRQAHGEVTAAIDRERARIEVERLERRAEELQARGAADEAERVRTEAEMLRRDSAIEAAQRDRELALERETGGLKTDLRDLLLEAERLRARGDDDEARQLETEAADLKRELGRLHVDAARELETHDRARLAYERERLIHELSRANLEGDSDQARDLDRRIEIEERARLEHELARQYEEHARKMALEHERRELELARQYEEQARQMALEHERGEAGLARETALEREQREMKRAREHEEQAREMALQRLKAELDELEHWEPATKAERALREDRLRELRVELETMEAR